MQILVGSAALKYWCDTYKLGKVREPKDSDYFADKCPRDFYYGNRVESFYHPDLEKWNWFGGIATLNELYTIKISHIFWPKSWEKHAYDIMFMKRISNVELQRELYDILYPIWVERFGKKKANFNVSKDEFFNARVKRIYDHDSIHAAVAYGDEPLYKSILKDGEAVAIDKSKYDGLQYEDKLNLAREEIYATALERTLIPDPFASPRAAYMAALKSTVTSYTKGDFALFIALNLDKLYKPDCNFYERFRQNKDKLIIF